MADTITVEMTGSWIAVAGAGWVTITPEAIVRWAEDATGPEASLGGHVARAWEDRAFTITSQLWLLGDAGVGVAVTRETAPA